VNPSKININCLFKKVLPFVLLSIIFNSFSAAAKTELNLPGFTEADKHKVLRWVSLKWIEIGDRHYQRNYYRQAEISYLHALEHQSYLSAKEVENLERSLQKTHAANQEKENVLRHIKTAKQLINQGQLEEARSHLELVKASMFITKTEKQLVVQSLAEIKKKVFEAPIGPVVAEEIEQPKIQTEPMVTKPPADIEVPEPVEVYKEEPSETEKTLAKIISEIKKAEAQASVPEIEIFEPIVSDIKIPGIPTEEIIEAEPVEGYREQELVTEEIVDIAAEPEDIISEPEVAEKQVPEKETKVKKRESFFSFLFKSKPKKRPVKKEVPAEKTESVTEETKPAPIYTEAVGRKLKMLKSYAKAVVKDAVRKAEDFVEQGKFYKGQQAVQSAKSILNEKRALIGEELYTTYNNRLERLNKKIEKGRSQWLGQL